MSTYNINYDSATNILKIAFGEPSQNDQIVRDASSRVAEMLESGELPTGGVLRINGPASLPVAFVLAHAVAHVFEAIGCFDPKLNKYVVCIAHGSEYAVGDLIS